MSACTHVFTGITFKKIEQRLLKTSVMFRHQFVTGWNFPFTEQFLSFLMAHWYQKYLPAGVSLFTEMSPVRHAKLPEVQEHEQVATEMFFWCEYL